MGWTCAPQAPGKHLSCPQISQVGWNNNCLFLNIHICIPLIRLLVSKPRRRVTFPNISFYLGLEMCTAPLNRISVPPLVVQVQLWLQEKCHSEPTALTPRGAFSGEDLCSFLSPPVLSMLSGWLGRFPATEPSGLWDGNFH